MEIKLYNDIVFKWAFGREEHPAPLISLLNSVVGHEGEKPEFTEIRIVNPYDRSEPFTGEKQGILDIRAQDARTGEWADVEIQVAHDADYAARSKFYLAGMYRDQLKKSSEKNYDELKACYGIHLLVADWFRDKEDEKR